MWNWNKYDEWKIKMLWVQRMMTACSQKTVFTVRCTIEYWKCANRAIVYWSKSMAKSPLYLSVANIVVFREYYKWKSYSISTFIPYKRMLPESTVLLPHRRIVVPVRLCVLNHTAWQMSKCDSWLRIDKESMTHLHAIHPAHVNRILIVTH